MAREPENYWEKRQTELMKRVEKNTLSSINKVVNSYTKATNDIKKEMQKIFNKYIDDNELTKNKALELLSKKESKEIYEEILNKISTISDEEEKKSLIAKYNAPAYAYRISRYQALQDSIEIELKKLADIEEEISKLNYVDTINDVYYRTIYNVQQDLGVGFSFNQIDKRTIDMLLNKEWLNKGNYSTRVWENSNKLYNYLKDNMLSNYLSGKSIQKMSRDLEETMEIGKYQATRLLRTETNYLANQTELLSYKECGIEEYQFIATLDKITCKHCAELDKKVFKISEAKPGKNCPPVHPQDRCATVAYFSDNVKEELQRRAKDENGETILILQDMNYNEWKSKYIDMTQNERDSISKYSGSTSYSLNYKLRSNIDLDQYEKELVKNIDKGLEKIPNYTKTTYRQIGFDFQGEEEYNKFINYHENNKIINYSQYISTSKNYNDYEVIDNLKVEITIEGKTGKDIRGLTGLKDENEVLFRRDTRFKVVKVDGNKIWLKEV